LGRAERPHPSLLGATIGFGDRVPYRSDRACSLPILAHFSDPPVACRLGETSPCVTSAHLFSRLHPSSTSPLRWSSRRATSAQLFWEAQRSSPHCLALSSVALSKPPARTRATSA